MSNIRKFIFTFFALFMLIINSRILANNENLITLYYISSFQSTKSYFVTQQNINSNEYNFTVFLKTKKLFNNDGLFISGIFLKKRYYICKYFSNTSIKFLIYDTKTHKKVYNAYGYFNNYFEFTNSIILTGDNIYFMDLKTIEIRKEKVNGKKAINFINSNNYYYIKNKEVYHHDSEGDKKLLEGYNFLLFDKVPFLIKYIKNKDNSYRMKIFKYFDNKIKQVVEFKNVAYPVIKYGFIILYNLEKIYIYDENGIFKIKIPCTKIINIVDKKIYYKNKNEYFVYNLKTFQSKKINVIINKNLINKDIFNGKFNIPFNINRQTGLCFMYLYRNLFYIGQITNNRNFSVRIPFLSRIIKINNKSINNLGFNELANIKINQLEIVYQSILKDIKIQKITNFEKINNLDYSID